MSTYKAESVPVLTNAAGRDDKDFNFEIDEQAQVYKSCSLTWENELYVFGGNSLKNQISKVKSCRLEPIGKLEFDHHMGDCVNVASEKIVLCFNDDRFNGDRRRCRLATSPTGVFSVMTPSQYDHEGTRIATDNGKFK